jgi:glycosyltransferase involved in cell wall biosynthesis
MKIPNDLIQRLEILRAKQFQVYGAERAASCSEISDQESLFKSPLVSVHMITYNHEAYIEEAVESVASQECDFEFEIVIGEDCSTDRTRALCLELQKKYPCLIRLIVSESNVGIVGNGCRLRTFLRGAYVAFCEGDDYWHDKSKLTQQVAFLRSNPSVGMVFGKYHEVWSSDGRTVANVGAASDKDCIYQHGDNLVKSFIYHDLMPLTVTIMVKRDVYVRLCDEYEILRKSYSFPDTQVWIACASFADVAYLNTSSATYRRVGSSATLDKQFEKRWLYTIDGYLVLLSCASLFLKDDATRAQVYRWVIRLFSTRLLTLLMAHDQPNLRKQYINLLDAIPGFFSVGDRWRIWSARNKTAWHAFRVLSAFYCWIQKQVSMR